MRDRCRRSELNNLSDASIFGTKRDRTESDWTRPIFLSRLSSSFAPCPEKSLGKKNLALWRQFIPPSFRQISLVKILYALVKKTLTSLTAPESGFLNILALESSLIIALKDVVLDGAYSIGTVLNGRANWRLFLKCSKQPARSQVFWISLSPFLKKISFEVSFFHCWFFRYFNAGHEMTNNPKST